MTRRQCPYCRDIFEFKAPLRHRCGLAFVLPAKPASLEACVKIGGSVILFAGLIAMSAKFF
jgi:hypothetical protein